MELKRLSTGDGTAIDVDEAEIESGTVPIQVVAAAVTREDATQEERTVDIKMSVQQQPDAAVASIIMPSPVNGEKKLVIVDQAPDVMAEDSAPVPVSQTPHARKDTKQNKGVELLDLEASQPFDAGTQGGSILGEKEKMKASEQAVSRAPKGIGSDTKLAPQAVRESTSHPPTHEEAQLITARLSSVDRLPSLQTDVTATTAAITMSSDTIFDAFSQRASTVHYTEGHDFLIPEATLVEEPVKEDIPSAEVVEPERYSLTCAGKKIHAGVLGIVALLIIALAVGLSVTRSSITSKMPSLPPTSPPTSTPTTVFYSSLVERVYGEDLAHVDFNYDRQMAMSWLEDDQVDASFQLSDEGLRERYALALLFFITNANGNWYDGIKFLSDDHVCGWRMKRSGDKKGVLLCNEDGRVTQLALYGNSLERTIPMELKFLTELEVLRFDSNRMDSTIPNAIGSLSNLIELNLNNNVLTGNIPESLTSLHNLITLHLSDNIFSGPILDVAKLTSLSTFRVDGNNFSGTIPKSFGEIHLNTFHINRNRVVSSMDFMCNTLPIDYKMDCDGEEPEIICTCCVGCTIIGDDTCETNEKLASITITSGDYDDVFSWQLYQEVVDEFGQPVSSLIAAGGNYFANEEISFKLCLGFPGQYYFATKTNETDDSGASIEVSIGNSDFAVDQQEIFTFQLAEDGSFENATGWPEGISVPMPSQTDDELSDEASISYKYDSCISFEMQLKTDMFGDETSWDITNTIDGSVTRSVSRGFYESNTTYYEYDCLDSSGCYSFTIYDQWNDGICCASGEGYFNISTNDRFLYRGGDYKSSDSVIIGGSCSAAVPRSESCPINQSPINITIQTDSSANTLSWEVYDNVTGQIYSLNTDTMENNTLYSIHQCIPKDQCMTFVIKDSAGYGLNGTAGGFYQVTYDGMLVVSARDFGYRATTYFGESCS